MTYRIPKNGIWYQPNRGEISGALFRSTGIDLKTNPGKLRPSPPLALNTKDNDAGITGLGLPIGFVIHEQGFGKQYYAACGVGIGQTTGSGKMMVTPGDDLSVAFANETRTGTPTLIHQDFSDMVEWNGGLFVSTFAGIVGSDIARLVAQWTADWYTSTVSGSFRDHLTPKNLCVGFNNNLYITDEDRIIYVDTSNVAHVPNGPPNTTSGVIDFENQYFTNWIQSTSDKLWLALMSKIPAINSITSAGSSTKGYIGIWDTVTLLPTIVDIQAPCALAGVVRKDVLYIIDAYGILKRYNGTGFEEVARLPVANLNIEMPGIYDATTNARWIHPRGMSLVDGKINVNVNNYVSAGVYVNEMPSGVWELNEDDPAHPFFYHKASPRIDSNDYGQQQVSKVGALFGSKRSTATYLAGFSYFTDATTIRKGIFHDDLATTSGRRSIIVTPWFDSQQILDSFTNVWYRFRKFISGSKVKAKFRTDKVWGLPFVASVTWGAADRFTYTDTNFQYASVGDEVEIVQGANATKTAHITLITSNAVELDEAIGPTSGTGMVRVENFTQQNAADALLASSARFGVGVTDNSIQVKAELVDEGGFELNDITITSKTQQEGK